MELPSYLILNEHEKKRIFSISKNKLNEKYYNTLLEKLKKENEGSNISTTVKTKHVKKKFAKAQKISFDKNENNINEIIDKVFDKEKENVNKNEKIKLYLFDSRNEINNNEKKYRKKKNILNQHVNIYNIDTNKHVDEDKKNVSNKFLKCLLCCCPMN